MERGGKQRFAEEETRVAGLRTYTLIGLLGDVAGLLGRFLGPIAFGAIMLVFGVAWTAYGVAGSRADRCLPVLARHRDG